MIVTHLRPGTWPCPANPVTRCAHWILKPPSRKLAVAEESQVTSVCQAEEFLWQKSWKSHSWRHGSQRPFHHPPEPPSTGSQSLILLSNSSTLSPQQMVTLQMIPGKPELSHYLFFTEAHEPRAHAPQQEKPLQ